MRAYSWIVASMVALACGGGAFNSGGAADGEGGSGDDDSGGTVGSGGKVGSGGSVGSGGKLGTGGVVGRAGGIGVAGDLGIAGALIMGGTPGISGSSSTGGTMGPDPIDQTCPTDLPETGKACKDGLTCSYGTDIRPSCRTRAKCDGGGWNIYEADACPTLHACTSNVAPGASCNQDTPACVYLNNQYCQCLLCTGNVCGTEPSWYCVGSGGEAGCPKVIPNEGQPCAGDKQCSYGSCGVSEVVYASCKGTTWGWESAVCTF